MLYFILITILSFNLESSSHYGGGVVQETVVDRSAVELATEVTEQDTLKPIEYQKSTPEQLEQCTARRAASVAALQVRIASQPVVTYPTYCGSLKLDPTRLRHPIAVILEEAGLVHTVSEVSNLTILPAAFAIPPLPLVPVPFLPVIAKQKYFILMLE